MSDDLILPAGTVGHMFWAEAASRQDCGFWAVFPMLIVMVCKDLHDGHKRYRAKTKVPSVIPAPSPPSPAKTCPSKRQTKQNKSTKYHIYALTFIPSQDSPLKAPCKAGRDTPPVATLPTPTLEYP